MKTNLLRSVAIAAMAVFAVCAMLPTSVDAAKKEKAPKVPQLNGVVESVDAENNTVTLKVKKESKTVTVNDETMIATSAIAEGAKLEDLSQGMKVQVQYEEVDGNIVAKSIKEQVAKPAKEKKPKKDKGGDESDDDMPAGDE
jgi:Cu/Ag efflux protein CusF